MVLDKVKQQKFQTTRTDTKLIHVEFQKYKRDEYGF